MRLMRPPLDFNENLHESGAGVVPIAGRRGDAPCWGGRGRGRGGALQIEGFENRSLARGAIEEALSESETGEVSRKKAGKSDKETKSRKRESSRTVRKKTFANVRLSRFGLQASRRW